MSRGGEASGTGASRTLTKPSGSIRATLTCSNSARFPMSCYVVSQTRCESLIKFNFVPGDVDTLVDKARIAQVEGDLLRASAILVPLQLNADSPGDLQTHVYQAILERHPAQIIPRFKEMLANPDPALGYINGELRFWLGLAQEVAGDHAAAQESWRQALSELEPFLKEQPENLSLIVDLALTNAY